MADKFGEYTEVRKPKKPHKCVWCHGSIDVGEPHKKFVGLSYGDFQNWRIHLDCVPPEERSWALADELICPEPHTRGGECKH